MDKEFVSYEQALALKELGFDEPCFAYYDVCDGYAKGYSFCYSNVGSQDLELGCLAPLYSQVFRWFRENHNLYSHVRESYSFDKILEFVSQINGSYVNHGIYDKPVNRFETYEEAELACLIKLIELVKQKL